jgi:hypothetical protein
MADDIKTETAETPTTPVSSETPAPAATAVAPAPEVPETETPGPLRLIGGEIHIKADARTGGISVNAPPNMIVALGLLEVGKAILIKKQQEQMVEIEKMRSRIVAPGAADLSALRGRA